MPACKDFWLSIQQNPPTLKELLHAEPLLRHLDPVMVERALAVLLEVAREADYFPGEELVHLILRGRLGPRPTSRLIIRACHKLAGRRVERLGFSKAFEPSPPSPRQVYEHPRSTGKRNEDAA